MFSLPYCIKCGVELSESEKNCPLCKTVVYHPDIEIKEDKGTYPPFVPAPDETVSRSGVLFVLSLVFIIPLLVTLLCDININGRITWSGYAVGAIFTSYIIVVLPFWFKKANPVIFASADFVAIGLFLLLINTITGGRWFMSFAFPVTAGAMIICVGVITLLHYVRKGILFTLGGAFIASGFYAVLIEFFLNQTFKIRDFFIWSMYPFVALFLIGIGLIIIGICKPLRESLHRKFFI